jgi:hypothetical protein
LITTVKALAPHQNFESNIPISVSFLLDGFCTEYE